MSELGGQCGTKAVSVLRHSLTSYLIHMHRDREAENNKNNDFSFQLIIDEPMMICTEKYQRSTLRRKEAKRRSPSLAFVEAIMIMIIVESCSPKKRIKQD